MNVKNVMKVVLCNFLEWATINLFKIKLKGPMSKVFIKYKLNISAEVSNSLTSWTKHFGDIGMLKSLFFVLDDRRAAGKIVG